MWPLLLLWALEHGAPSWLELVDGMASFLDLEEDLLPCFHAYFCDSWLCPAKESIAGTGGAGLQFRGRRCTVGLLRLM